MIRKTAENGRRPLDETPYSRILENFAIFQEFCDTLVQKVFIAFSLFCMGGGAGASLREPSGQAFRPPQNGQCPNAFGIFFEGASLSVK